MFKLKMWKFNTSLINFQVRSNFVCRELENMGSLEWNGSRKRMTVNTAGLNHYLRGVVNKNQQLDARERFCRSINSNATTRPVVNTQDFANVLKNVLNYNQRQYFNVRTFCTQSKNDAFLERPIVLSKNKEPLQNVEPPPTKKEPPRRPPPLKVEATPKTRTKKTKKSITKTDVRNILESIPEGDSETVKDVTLDVKKLFPFPKNTLNTIISIVAQDIGKKQTLKPTFRLVKINESKSHWSCTYKLAWPEELAFTGVSLTKKESSYKAAYAALTYMLQNKKITEKGQPILFGQKEMKELTKSTTEALILNPNILRTLDEINDIFEKKMTVEMVTSGISNLDIHDKKDETVNLAQEELHVFSRVRPKFLSTAQYMSKEKVHLPITDYKEKFQALLRDNQIIIVKGEPGCGKSTRVPQYVLEEWAQDPNNHSTVGRIAVTQPRRIAAISLAETVSRERDENVGHIVGYQVRLKSSFRPVTGRILYCTTGILLRHLQSDPLLKNFSHVILDEAHERDVNTDLLMNLLRSACDKNPSLKLVVMSATIDTDMFQQYFKGAATLHVPGFTYPVKMNFLNDLDDLDLSKTERMCESNQPTVIQEDVASLIRYLHRTKPEGAILVFLPGWEDINKIRKLLEMRSSSDMSVLCLHSKLQDDVQWKIFSRPPPGVRKVILSTNIAETSVTIDDIGYVIDTGIHKETRFDLEKGVMCIDNHWVSQASVKQRKGRAGRVREGESFHLYPKAKYNEFEPYSLPEILRTSLTKIVLDSKVFSNNMNALKFMSELPTPPDENATAMAVDELLDLELIQAENENLTKLGRTLADFQLEPKLAKAMVNSVVYKCVTPIIDIVTLFSSDIQLFRSSLGEKDKIRQIKEEQCQDSDHLALMRIFELWMEFKEKNRSYYFVNQCNLVDHKLEFAEKMREIHFGYLHNGLTDALPLADDNSDNDEMVKAVLLSGVGTILRHRNWDIVRGRYKKVNTFITRHNHRATLSQESVVSRKAKFASKYLMYINETRSNIRRTTIIREASVMNPLAVLLFKNKELFTKDIPKEDFNSMLDSEDQVLIGLKETKIHFLCDREQAAKLIKCKNAISACYQYYITQITDKGTYNPEMNHYWDRVLSSLNQILNQKVV